MSEKAKRGRGRPAKHTPQLIEEICQRISEGEPLAEICRLAHMPERRTVYDWLAADADFSSRFARARDVGFDAIAEEALKIADTPQDGVVIEDDGEKVKEKRGDMLGHRKLQVETRLKLLAKWNPKKYGDRQEINHSGTIGLESLVGNDSTE